MTKTKKPKISRPAKVAKPRKKPKANIRKNGEVDLRTLPLEERPKPTSGQSRKEFNLPLEELSDYEAKVLKVTNGKGSGLRETWSVAKLAKTSRLTPLQVRNSIRRLIPSGWLEHVHTILTDAGEPHDVRGHYRMTDKGRKRLS